MLQEKSKKCPKIIKTKRGLSKKDSPFHSKLNSVDFISGRTLSAGTACLVSAPSVLRTTLSLPYDKSTSTRFLVVSPLSQCGRFSRSYDALQSPPLFYLPPRLASSSVGSSARAVPAGVATTFISNLIDLYYRSCDYFQNKSTKKSLF